MNIASEMMLCTQQIQRTVQQLHRHVGTADNTRTQKQTFDIITPVKADRQFADLLRRENRSRNIVGTAVQTIFTVINTFICQKYFQKRNAPAVRAEAVADTGSKRIPHIPAVSAPVHSAARARHVI